MIEKNKAAYCFLFFSLFLLLLTRPRFDLGFSLSPAYLILIFLFFLPHFRSIKIYAHEVILLLFYIYCSASAIYGYDLAHSFRFVFGACLFVLLFFILKIFLSLVTPSDFKKGFFLLGKVYFSLSFMLYIFGVLNFNNLNEHDLYAGVYIERGFIRMTGLSFDPNMFGITLIPFLFFFLMSKNLRWFLFGSALLILSFSRGAWVAFFLGLIVFYFMQGIHRSFKLTILLLLFFSICLLFYRYDIFSFGVLIDSRLKNISDGSGRYEIWMNAINLFLEKPIGGWGIFSFRPLNLSLWGNDRFAHNTYIEILVETGILGILLFLLFLFFVFVRLYSVYKKHKDFGFLIPSYFGLLTGLLFLSLYINNLFLFFVLLFGIGFDKKEKDF